MKVLLISTSSGSRGGGEIYLKQLAIGLLQEGVQVVLAMSHHPQMNELADDCRLAGIEVSRFVYTNTYHRRLRSLAAAFDWRLVRALHSDLAAWKPDLIHLNQQTVEDGLDLLLAIGRAGIPAVTTVHQPAGMRALKALGGGLRDRVSRRVFRKAGIDAIGVSQLSAKCLASFLERPLCADKWPAKTAEKCGPRVLAVTNGVPMPNVRSRAEVRLRWGIADETLVLGCLARIEYEKNPLFVVELLKSLPENVQCVWIGDGRLRQSLEQRIQSEGLQSRFRITGWEKDAAQFLSGFDVFLLPSLYEGLPLALLESMAASVPSVVSNLDGVQGVISHGVDGYVCPVNDVQAWRSALQSLIESPDLRSRIGLAARRRYESEFSLEAMARRTVAVYEDVVRARGE